MIGISRYFLSKIALFVEISTDYQRDLYYNRVKSSVQTAR